MTVPRAVGVRLPYAAVPAAVRAWVEGRLGSPVVATAEQVGGMSPGWADALRRQAALPMPQVVHWDVRVDNLLRRPSGEVVFVDWGVAARGPGWVDPLLARMERVDDPWFDDSVSTSPALAEAGDEAVTAFLAGFGAHLAVRSVVAVDVNLPTLNDFRIRESRRMLEAVARRAGR